MTAGALLLTGAAGFVGSYTLKALRIANPDRVLIIAGRSVATSPSLQRLHLDLTASTLDLPRGIDTVLHLAAEKHDVSSMQAVNHVGTARLVAAAGRAGIRSFVHLSTVGVYGAPKHAGVVDEKYDRTPQNAYETSKDAGERAVQDQCSALGMRYVVLQPSNVIGVVPGRSNPLLGLVRIIGRGWFHFFGRNEAWVNYVAVEDVAAALSWVALDETAQGVFILNTPAPLSAFTRWIAEELGKPTPSAHLPLWIGATAAGGAAMVQRLLRLELPFSPERFRELTNTTRYDGSAITRTLGFAYPIGIEAALRSMVRLYRRERLV